MDAIKLVKNPADISKMQTPVEQKFNGPAFSVQANATTSDIETLLKIKGAFKIRVQNKGNVGIKIFGNFDLPSYADETFETGDTNLGFSSDATIQYDTHTPTDKINIITTAYFRS